MTDWDQADGLLADGSVLRRTTREAVGLLGAGRMLLLQLAHPLVAEGVFNHSRFREQPLRRMQGTLDMMHRIIFGSRGEAGAALREFHQVHVPVAGALAAGAADFPAGAAYSGQDPALKWWVLATMLHTNLLVHEQFVAPLTAGERARYYEDGRVVARHMGVPERLLPRRLEGLQDYFEEMVAGGELGVTDAARELARSAFYPNVWAVPRACAVVVRFVTPGLMPERLRAAFGMEWNARREAGLRAFASFSRAVLPVVPGPVRLMRGPGRMDFVRWALGEKDEGRRTKDGGRTGM